MRYALSMIRFRPASPDDAPVMARVTVDTWFVAHRGHVSDEAFQQRREDWGYPESEQGWSRSIREADGVSAQVIVATDDGHVVAVAASKVTGADSAEVTALYVDAAHQRSGVGRRIVEAALDHYRGLGMTTLHIAVLATNGPARHFYEAVGGWPFDTRDDDDGSEIVYAWDLRNAE